MSKISNLVKSQNKENREKAVLNFMGEVFNIDNIF